MKYFYSVGVSVECETQRIECVEILGTTRKRDAIREKKKIEKDILLGKWRELLYNDGEFLTATIEVHDNKTFELIEII